MDRKNALSVLACVFVIVGLISTIALAYTIWSDILHVPAETVALTYSREADQLTLIATLNTGESGVEVTFYECSATGSNAVSLGTKTTDSFGMATYTIMPYDNSVDHWYRASYDV